MITCFFFFFFFFYFDSIICLVAEKMKDHNWGYVFTTRNRCSFLFLTMSISIRRKKIILNVRCLAVEKIINSVIIYFLIVNYSNFWFIMKLCSPTVFRFFYFINAIWFPVVLFGTTVATYYHRLKDDIFMYPSVVTTMALTLGYLPAIVLSFLPLDLVLSLWLV